MGSCAIDIFLNGLTQGCGSSHERKQSRLVKDDLKTLIKKTYLKKIYILKMKRDVSLF